MSSVAITYPSMRLAGFGELTSDERSHNFLRVDFTDVSRLLDVVGFGFAIGERHTSEDVTLQLKRWWLSVPAAHRVLQLQEVGFEVEEAEREIVAIAGRIRDDINFIVYPIQVDSILQMEARQIIAGAPAEDHPEMQEIEAEEAVIAPVVSPPPPPAVSKATPWWAWALGGVAALGVGYAVLRSR